MVTHSKAICHASFILFILSTEVTGRVLRSGFVSDGTNDTTRGGVSSFLYLKGIDVPEQRCEQMYGFLPCSETLLGHFFLIVVYEYLLFHGESYVSSGGKRIFQILGPGIFGASAFQVLGFLPESLILLVSGLSGTKDVAQEYVLTGVGLLAGSAILLLTVIWGTCVIVGGQKFSSESSSSTSVIPTQNQYEKLLSYFTGSGVTTDEETSHAAKIMVISVIPFAFLLIPEIFFGVSQGYIFMIPLSVSFMFLIVYFIYQVYQEFIDGIREWLNTSDYQLVPMSPGPTTNASLKPWERWINDDGVDRSKWAWTKAIMLLVLGITMLALLAEPLIHSVQNVSSAANIPSFFISFILVPLATNARAAIIAVKTARKRNEKTTSLTFSELYDGVFMNNVLGFSVLLAVIYFRGLTWDFSAEVLVVLIVTIIMGTAASFRSKFPIWTSFMAYLLYPLSLIFVYLFNRF